ncbi:hypothetical protein NL351_28045, partial [Klebsiella pneumoniae]|nr:hypothetical protein [Klebsiella pneumoniae]
VHVLNLINEVDLYLSGAHNAEYIVRISSALKELLTNSDVVTSSDNAFRPIGFLHNVETLTLRKFLVDDIIRAIIRRNGNRPELLALFQSD